MSQNEHEAECKRNDTRNGAFQHKHSPRISVKDELDPERKCSCSGNRYCIFNNGRIKSSQFQTKAMRAIHRQECKRPDYGKDRTTTSNDKKFRLRVIGELQSDQKCNDGDNGIHEQKYRCRFNLVHRSEYVPQAFKRQRKNVCETVQY